MNAAIHEMLTAWTNFYLITGSAAAALTGLQFVVQTLVASNDHMSRGGEDPEGGIAAFASPTVFHFTLSLILSAVMCVPWAGYTGLRETLAVFGIGALIYSLAVLGRARRQEIYKPVASDWLWHTILPVAAYIAILVAAARMSEDYKWPLFIVAAATLSMVCIGIHNAWDTVTYLTIAAFRHTHGHPAATRQPPHKKGKRHR